MRSTFFIEANDHSHIASRSTDLSSDREEEIEKHKENSYGQIVKTSSIIGGAQVINMVAGLVRTKMVAVLIGPSGIGLLSIYQSITGLATTIAGLGISTSGVREVSIYSSNGDAIGMAKTVRTVRRVSWFTGLAGMILLMVLAPWISFVSFGTRENAWAIAALGIATFLANISAGQAAVIQGTRRIGDIARISIWGSMASTTVAVGLYWSFGTHGMIPALVATAFVTLLVSTHYSRKIRLEDSVPTWSETWAQSRGMVNFGVAMVISGCMVTGVDYVNRLLVAQHYETKGVGIYTAAFSVSGIFVQFILGAMGADFYPRLTSESGNHLRMGQLINEQTEIGLLLSYPSLVATLAFAPWFIRILYTNEFSEANVLLQWFVVGCLGRVLSWPLGYSILAKGQSAMFISTEVFFCLLHLFLVWIGLKTAGLPGAAIAFALLYIFYTTTMLVVCRFTIGFRWSSRVRLFLLYMIVNTLLLLLIDSCVSELSMALIGGVNTLVCGLICLIQLANRLGGSTRWFNI